jgi:uncharacterized membrane protein (UPF0127 family)
VTRRIALALLLAGAVAVVVAIVVYARDDGSDDTQTLHLATKPAVAPFAGLTEAKLAVGRRCLRVVVADDEAEREQGLRTRSDIGPYDGMLFVFGAPIEARFTMSTVPIPLDIGFYRADGSYVARRHMTPCPRAEAECPTYGAGAPFAYALETEGGALPSGALSACS